MGAVRVEQHFRERVSAMDSDGFFTEIEVCYIAFGAADETEALRAVRESVPEEREGLPRRSLRIESRCGEDSFLVAVAYRRTGAAAAPGLEREEEPQVSFDCGGGTRHMTHSYSQRIAYGRRKAGGAIGWNGKSGSEMAIAGVDVPTAQLRETYTKTMRLSDITTAFKRKAARLVGKVNSRPFKGWSKGEAMFLGMSYSCPAKGSAKASVAFSFAIQLNEETTVCGKSISKKGFEYAWGLSGASVDPETGVPKTDVEAIYIDEVCRSDDFSALGL